MKLLSVLSVCNAGVLWPKGWMDQDATWYGRRPRPRRHCVKWGPSSPLAERGTAAPPHFSAHVYCGETVPISATAEILFNSLADSQVNNKFVKRI